MSAGTLLIVVDRRVPEAADIVEQCGFELTGDPHFTRWIAAPERDRFVLVQVPALSVEDAFTCAATEDDLIEAILLKYLDIRKALGIEHEIRIEHYVGPDLLEKLKRMRAEIIEATRLGMVDAEAREQRRSLLRAVK